MKILRKPKRGEFKMGIDFTFDEMMVLAIFEEDSKSKSIDTMYEVLDVIHDDPDMEELVISALEKLEHLSDEEYLQIDFREYDLYMDELDDYRINGDPAVALVAALDVGKIDFALPNGMIVEATYEGM